MKRRITALLLTLAAAAGLPAAAGPASASDAPPIVIGTGRP